MYRKNWQIYERKNTMKDLKSGSLSYIIARDFLSDLEEEFSRGDNKMKKVAELKKIKQEEKTIEEFVQEFKQTTRESKYEGRLSVEKFKRGINEVIRRKLIETERPLRSIKQWYEQVVNLDKY